MNATTIHIPFDEELLPALSLRFGRFSCIYEHGRIRYIRSGDVELIRMVYFAVRDKDWNTSPYTINTESIGTRDNGFAITYAALHTLDDISYRSDVSITATGDTIRFSVKGEALGNFHRNRIGICVLHPIKECRGKHVIIERPDRTTYESSFPDLIDPYQPFQEVRKMQYAISSDDSVDIVFSGDIFETEDQRNWADSSFKTYSTPLGIPLPVQVKQGDTLEQTAELKFTAPEPVDIHCSVQTEKKVAFPKIGYCSTIGELTENEIKLLAELPFEHFRVEVLLKDPQWKAILSIRIDEAIKLNTSLELILFFDEDDESELGKFITAIRPDGSIVSSILILHPATHNTDKNLFDMAYQRIKAVCPNIEVGYGTNGFFADLNRNRPDVDASFDFVSFPLTPQVHASDTRSVMENLQNQDDLIQTAKSFAKGKKVHVSPITFKIRTLARDHRDMPADSDPRQHRSFGALWTLQSIKNLAEADRLTFYDVKGYRGILNPQYLEELSPTFHLLKRIKGFGPKWIIHEGEQQGLLPDIILENEKGDRLKLDFQSARMTLDTEGQW